MSRPSLPAPRNGMVVRYRYQWVGGQSSGKERPACIVLVVGGQGKTTPDDPQVVYLPITSQLPLPGFEGLRIPDQICRQLGLPKAPSWVIVSECNIQAWPFDLSRVPSTDGEWIYGQIGSGFFATITQAFETELKRRKGVIRQIGEARARREGRPSE